MVLVALCTGSSAQQLSDLSDDIDIVSNVAIIRTEDDFAEPFVSMFVVLPGNAVVTAESVKDSSQFLSAVCIDGRLDGLVVQFGQALKPPEDAPISYRIDAAAVGDLSGRVEGARISLYASSQSTTSVPNALSVLAGSRFALKAVSSQGEEVTVRYNVSRLGEVVAQRGCAY